MKRLPAAVSSVVMLVTMVVAPQAAFADDDELAPLPVAPPPAAASGASSASGSAAKITEVPGGTVDTVHLRSGGLYRGRVTEIVPGSHVLVMVPSGESHKVPWADVERVIVASTSIPSAPGGPVKVDEKPAAPKVGPLARVHLTTTSTKAAFLYRRAAGTDDFVTACQAPCDELMPLGDTYRVGGSGMKSSAEFHLKGNEGDTINVGADGPSWLGIAGGGTLVVGGGLAAYVGTILALSGGHTCSSSYSYANGAGYTSRSGSCTDLRPAGFVSLGLGAGAIALGLVILYPSLKTDIEQERANPRKDAFVRQPTWRSASAQESATPGTAFPLLYTGQF